MTVEKLTRSCAALAAAFAMTLTAHDPAIAGAGAEGHGHGSAEAADSSENQEHGGAHSDGHGHNAEIGSPADKADASRTIRVTMRDNYYKPARIEVKQGETVHFVLTNEGKFIHEFNIGTSDIHAAHQKEMAAMMENGALTATGLNHDMMNGEDGHAMKHDDPNSILLEPGETAELTWNFPMGTNLEFACNVPGHYESGMVGKIHYRSGESS